MLTKPINLKLFSIHSVKEYLRCVTKVKNKYPSCPIKTKCALSFWKNYQSEFPRLALLAQKYLSVPASSASVERMFSISSHIFSVKRIENSSVI